MSKGIHNNSLPSRGDECDEETVGLSYAPHNILGGHFLVVVAVRANTGDHRSYHSPIPLVINPKIGGLMGQVDL